MVQTTLHLHAYVSKETQILKLRVNELSPEEVEQMLPEIIDTIENNNAGQVEVAIPVYAAVKLAHEDGINVMFSGQGADGAFWRLSMVCKCS